VREDRDLFVFELGFICKYATKQRKKNKIRTGKVLLETEKEEKQKVLVQTLKGLGFCLRKKI
jgi:hypothetical protein